MDGVDLRMRGQSFGGVQYDSSSLTVYWILSLPGSVFSLL